MTLDVPVDHAVRVEMLQDQQCLPQDVGDEHLAEVTGLSDQVTDQLCD